GDLLVPKRGPSKIDLLDLDTSFLPVLSNIDKNIYILETSKTLGCYFSLSFNIFLLHIIKYFFKNHFIKEHRFVYNNNKN
ncbi:hypothetical protein COJ64_26690, partial [Bacillus cereus]